MFSSQTKQHSEVGPAIAKGVRMFCTEIVKTIQTFFDGIIEERSVLSFMKAQGLSVVSNLENLPSGLCLWVRTVSIIEDEKGSFTVKRDGGFLSFRNPQRIRASFALVAKEMDFERKVHLFDRIHRFFFENRMVSPVIPQSMHQYPELLEKLEKLRAEIILQKEDSEFNSHAFYLPFEYIGPYHSGETIHEGALVTQKMIDMNNRNERRLS